MKVASYFSGIGGMDLGLHKAGFEIVSQCEKDEFRREVLNERFPGTKIYKDVSEVYYGEPKSRTSAKRLREPDKRWGKTWAGLSGSIDLLCGGFPCQDLSIAGKRAGLAGERSGLFYEFARIADESVRDGGFVLIENVPGLFSSHKGKDFEIILSTLSECGFNDLSWRTLNSQYFGVPQRRRRIFILGRRTRGTSCAKILLEPESGTRDIESRSKKGKDNSTISISGLGEGGPDDNDAQAGRIVPVAFNWQTGGDFRLNLGDTSPALQRCQTVAIARPLSSRNERYDFETENFVAEYVGVRRLTPLECERLQGLPDNWTDVNGAKDTKRYAAIGDAVTVPVAFWLGKRILKYA